MKRIVLILLLIIPCFCWGQSTEKGASIKEILERRMPSNVIIKHDEGKIMSDTVCNSTVKGDKRKVLYVVDGVPFGGNLPDIKVEEIESISVLKEPWQKGIFCNLPPSVIVITTKPKQEYEVIVFDAGFEGFLATQKSKEFYSETFLKVKNTQMVIEWNQRHKQPSRYNPDIYEVNIDYDPKIDYGLEVEYQLYMFFRFMEKENGISLIGDYYAANI